jgi:hypothetical protein
VSQNAPVSGDITIVNYSVCAVALGRQLRWMKL